VPLGVILKQIVIDDFSDGADTASAAICPVFSRLYWFIDTVP
jgi:hypothetical protein